MGFALGISLGLRLYFIVYPDSSHNTDILNYNSSTDLPGISILEELILRIASTAGQYGKILHSRFSNIGELNFNIILFSKGSLKKKNIESLTAVKTPAGWWSQSSGYFFPCYKTFCVPPGSPKTYFVFTLNSMYHIFSMLFDSQDLISHGSHLIFVKSCLLFVCVFMVQINLKFYKIA